MSQNLECVYTLGELQYEVTFGEWIGNYVTQLGSWENIKALVSEVYWKNLILLSRKESNKIPSETCQTSYFTALEGWK